MMKSIISRTNKTWSLGEENEAAVVASQIVALLLALTVDSKDSVNKAHKLVNSVNNFIINVNKLSLCY